MVKIKVYFFCCFYYMFRRFLEIYSFIFIIILMFRYINFFLNRVLSLYLCFCGKILDDRYIFKDREMIVLVI